MARRIHDRVMLGIGVFLVLIVIAAVAAYLGVLGRWAETAASRVWDDAIAAADRWYASFDKLGKVAGFVVTLLSGAYVIYQKYYFAEFNMHKRLREFQERVDARLKEANAQIAKAVQRPSPRRKFEDPIFEDETLNPVLRQMKWGRRPRADQSLEATLRELEDQLDLWNGQKREYERRKAQACLLRGAIAAARAAKIGRNDGAEARQDNIEALEYFREAFELSGRTDTEALEYIGHQQVRLGDYAPALATFQQLASVTPQGRSLQRARHHRGTRVHRRHRPRRALPRRRRPGPDRGDAGMTADRGNMTSVRAAGRRGAGAPPSEASFQVAVRAAARTGAGAPACEASL